MTRWGIKAAVFLWAVLAFFLFLVIFYFHPKSFSGLLPFRAVSAVSQTSGPVTEINVVNRQRVSSGDILFRIEDSTQRAALAQAEASLNQISAFEAKAGDALTAAEAGMTEAEGNLNKLMVDLNNACTLLAGHVGTQDAVRQLEAQPAAELACDSNVGRSFRNAILPARVCAIQPAIQPAIFG